MITNKAVKILFCDNTLWGLINFRGDVIDYFKNHGAEVVLVAPEKEDEQMRISIPTGVKYIPIRMGRTTTNPVNDMRYFFRLLKIMRRERPDFVFNYTIKPNIYGSMAARFVGSHTTAMMAGLGYTFKNDTLPARVGRQLYKLGLHFTHHLLLLNAENEATVKARNVCDKSKIILLNGGEGVNLTRFTPHDNTSDVTTFLFIGRVLWEKGYDEFSKAARMVKARHPEACFKVLGSLDPSYPKSVPVERVRADERDGIIEYAGFTNDMNSVYAQKGVVITLPSYYGEGMNRSLMEACASAKPIITTDIAGCRELVVDGRNGFIVKPKDSEALAEAMLKYIDLSADEKAEFSLNSRKHAEERFDINKVISVYADIVSGKHGGGKR